MDVIAKNSTSKNAEIADINEKRDINNESRLSIVSTKSKK